MSQLLLLLFGIVSYLVGLGGLLWFVLFVGGWNILPVHIDSAEAGSVSFALAVNTSLMLLLGLQHSVMARPGFKKAWTRLIPPGTERSTYVLLSGVMFFLISLLWHPIPGTVWHLDDPLTRTIVTGFQLSGWGLVVASSFAINHFELFGLQQMYCQLVSRPEPVPSFTDRNLYRIVRHPLQLGVLIGIWLTATMTMTQLMLSIGMTMYIFIGLYLEEKDLVATLGQEYIAYQKRVPMILPYPRRAVAST